MQQGLIHIYCGTGKGKTTAALGLGLRACGNGQRVHVLHFLKSDNCSEHNAIKQVEGFSYQCVDQQVMFVFQMNDQQREELRQRSCQKLIQAFDTLKHGQIDMLILDEVLGAVQTNCVDEHLLLQLLADKPQHVEVVLTGRNATPKLVDMAHYVSDIHSVKHPYDSGISARKGIEW